MLGNGWKDFLSVCMYTKSCKHDLGSFSYLIVSKLEPSKKKPSSKMGHEGSKVGKRDKNSSNNGNISILLILWV